MKQPAPPSRTGADQHQYAVRAVHRVADILDALLRSPNGTSLGDVVRVVDLPKTSAFRYLKTLEDRGYVVRDEATSTYQLTDSLAARPALSTLAAFAQPHMEALRGRVEETVNLGTIDRTRVLYVAVVESPRAIRFSAHPGGHDLLHCTALGKALASQLSDETVARILAAEGLPLMTKSTIHDAPAFFEDVHLVRTRGWALDDGENEPGGRCVAVPIPGLAIPAAVSVSAPTTRLPMDAVAGTVEMLLATAAAIAAEITIPRSPPKADGQL